MQRVSHILDRALQQEDTAGFKRSNDLHALVRRETVGGHAEADEFAADRIACHRVDRVVEALGCCRNRSRERITGFGLLRCDMVVDKNIRMTQPQHVFAGGQIPAVVKVDAQHADQLAVVLDEHCARAQRLALGREAAVVQAVVLRFVAFVHQDFERHIGKRCADLTAADVIVGDGYYGAVFVGHIMQSNLIIRSKCLSEKFCQLDVVLQQRISHLPTPFQRIFFAVPLIAWHCLFIGLL